MDSEMDKQPEYALFQISKWKKNPQSTSLPSLSHGRKVKIGYWKNVSFLILFPWVIINTLVILWVLQQGTDRLLGSFNTRSRVHLSSLLGKNAKHTLFPAPYCMKNKLCAVKRLVVNSFVHVIHWSRLKNKGSVVINKEYINHWLWFLGSRAGKKIKGCACLHSSEYRSVMVTTDTQFKTNKQKIRRIVHFFFPFQPFAVD